MPTQKAKKPHFITTGPVAENRKARFNYTIAETFEAGLSLTGAEVKSLRQGRANITDGYVTPSGSNLIINNITIGRYDSENPFNLHTEKRPRQLLLNRSEIRRLSGLYTKEHITIVPLKLYFNDRGLAKLLIGVGQGKNTSDKRQTIKEREWKREQARAMKR